MLKLVNVGKIYSQEGNISVGIRKVNLELNVGEFVAITGESGSGKTTLLNVISGIDTYEEGEMFVNGEETSYFSTEEQEEYRNKYVGFIFQNYNIIDSYTVKDNIEASLIFNGYPKEKIKDRVKELIKEVGLTKRTNTRCSKLSGGEKQRVVIARALAKDPLIIACDEPTGNLDSESSKQVMRLLHEISKDKLVVVVTHDFSEVEEYATRLIRVYDSEIKEDRILKETKSNDEAINNITYKKIKRYRLIPFSLKDLFSSPKRFIFNLIVFFVMSLIVVLSVGLYRNVTDDSIEITEPAFTNQDSRRIIINKKDKSLFTSEEINKIKNMNDVDFIIENDFVIDETISYYFVGSDYYFGYSSFIMNADYLNESELAYGRLPNNDNEIVITTTKAEVSESGYSSLESIIGKTIQASSSYSNQEYTIVGVVDASKIAKTISRYTYLYKTDFEEKKYEEYSYNYFRIQVTYQAGDYKEQQNIYKVDLAIDNTLSNTEVSIPKYGFVYDNISQANFNFKDQVYDSLSFSFDATIKGTNDDALLYVSEDNYNAIMNIVNSTKQISIFSESPAKTKAIYNSLVKSGYRAVISSEQTVDNAGASIISFVVLIFILQFLAGTMFVCFAILNHSQKSRKDDMEILRTIGATKSNLRFILTLNYMFTGFFSYILSVITTLILRFTTKGDFKVAIERINLLDYLFVFLLVMIMSYFLSQLFIRGIFKNSVRKGLSESRKS